jgi:hypothetical protein
MSYYPAVLALGLVIAIAGFMEMYYLSAIGIVITVWGLLGWTFEPASEEGTH